MVLFLGRTDAKLPFRKAMKLFNRKGITMAPIIAKILETAVASAAVTASKHIAEHPGETLEAVGEVVIIKPIEASTSAIEWLTNKIPS